MRANVYVAVSLQEGIVCVEESPLIPIAIPVFPDPMLRAMVGGYLLSCEPINPLLPFSGSFLRRSSCSPLPVNASFQTLTENARLGCTSLKYPALTLTEIFLWRSIPREKMRLQYACSDNALVRRSFAQVMWPGIAQDFQEVRHPRRSNPTRLFRRSVRNTEVAQKTVMDCLFSGNFTNSHHVPRNRVKHE